MMNPSVGTRTIPHYKKGDKKYRGDKKNNRKGGKSSGAKDEDSENEEETNPTSSTQHHRSFLANAETISSLYAASESTSWILDSGSTHHMYNNSSIMHNLRDSEYNVTFDKGQVKSSAIGSVMIKRW